MHSAIDTAGPLAAHIEWLFWVFVAVAVAVYVAVLGVLVYALRRRTKHEPRDDAQRDAAKRDARAVRYIGASAGLTAIVLAGLGLADFFAGRALARVPGDAMRVRVTAHQWWWEVEYLDADPSQRVRTANELHIPVNRPVALELISDDVIHSFWVPSLNGKKDLLPGYATSLQLVASRPGEYTGKCAEFCGFQHARMDIAVHAHEAGDFLEWQEGQRSAAAEPADDVQARGRDVFLKSTCPQCHMVLGTDAAAMFGPDLTHVASRPQLAAGTLPNNRAMLAAWITDPQRFKPGTRMPATELSSQDLAALVTWLMSLE
jgi:cytochrome c oxidase subunit 2